MSSGPAISTVEPPIPAQIPPKPLNQPLRWLIAAGEVVAAVGLVLLALWAWQRVTIRVQLPPSDNPAMPPFSTRWSGPWVTTAVAAATAAGLLLLDALRQAILAAATR